MVVIEQFGVVDELFVMQVVFLMCICLIVVFELDQCGNIYFVVVCYDVEVLDVMWGVICVCLFNVVGEFIGFLMLFDQYVIDYYCKLLVILDGEIIQM